MRSVPGSAIALLAVLGLACGQRRQQGVPTTRTVRLNTGQLMPRPPDQTASWSVRRALLTPRVNPGPLYRRGRSS